MKNSNQARPVVKKKVNLPRTAATRTSPRFEMQRLAESATKLDGRRPSLKIGRTVELVTQRNEDWRSAKSKLLFILGLGLMPSEHFGRFMQPSIVIKNIPHKDLNNFTDKIGQFGKGKENVHGKKSRINDQNKENVSFSAFKRSEVIPVNKIRSGRKGGGMVKK